jgi:hypothetical protein
MKKRNGNHANALKHGAFAKTTILPGEDPREFEELHSALVEEWAPVGPTEEDTVLTIATGMWRKRRSQKILQAEIKLDRLDRNHPLYDDVGAVQRLVTFLEGAPDSFDILERGINNGLSVGLATNLLKRCARQDFENPSAWREALCERASIMLPIVEKQRESSPEMLLMLSTKRCTSAVFEYEIKLDERIDAMIERAIKRLVQTKAMKQMLGNNSVSKGVDQPKKIPSNKGNGSAKIVPPKQGQPPASNLKKQHP